MDTLDKHGLWPHKQLNKESDEFDLFVRESGEERSYGFNNSSVIVERAMLIAFC